MTDNTTGNGTGDGMSEIDGLSAAYALNALSPDERELFEARLNESDDLRKEVADLNETALLLGRAVTPVTPSAGLRSSIMDLLDSTPQLPPLRAVEPGGAQDRAETPAAPAAVPADNVLAPIPLARQRWFMRPSVLLAAAAAAVAIFFGGVTVADGMHPQTAPTSQAQGGTSAAQILTASDVQHASSPVSTGGTATVYWSSSLQRSAVVLNGVSTLSAGKTYQLWYINGSVIRSAGLVTSPSGAVTQVLKGDLPAGATVGITVEPSGGSKQPTTTPIVAIPV